MTREMYRDVDVICRFPASPPAGSPMVVPLRIRQAAEGASASTSTDLVENVTCHWVSMCGAFPRLHLATVVVRDENASPGPAEKRSPGKQERALELVFDTERLRWSERIQTTAFAGPIPRGGR